MSSTAILRSIESYIGGVQKRHGHESILDSESAFVVWSYPSKGIVGQSLTVVLYKVVK